MKKQIIIALAFSVCAFSFAQKKELRAVEKAIKGKNYAEAKAALKQAEALMSSMDDKLKAQYYYLNAEALYADGAGSMDDIDAALKSLENVKEGYASEVSELKQTMVNGILTKGNKSYEGKDYSIASKYFEKAYRLSTKDTLFLYYAAATAVNVQEYDRALDLYEELKQLGYTGIEKQYFATNVETGEEEILDKNTRDLYVKAKSHKDPGERVTESKKPEIVKNVALIYISKGDDEKALAAMKEARAESPDDVNLILSEANIHYKLGNTKEFKALLEKATQMDPNNPELQYNLGVIAAESGQPEEAKAYYEKAIALDPQYTNAYINLAALVLSKEEAMIKEMNGLGSSKKDDLRYDELRTQRQDLYKNAAPYLTKALEIDSKNLGAAKTLMNIYSILGDTAKQKEMKAKVDALEAEGAN
ncbi:photosystem I assembly protein Ycf3 [Mariniflexile rhizosphaerae]|uniref:tetratricopeptide repeat protein n=1 Tax=unclassified Mariniflexile TaxID=2643887 RepID=UPI000CBB2983|nr:tetratricopeptide repeat protein [Mariniflexile sp. TRM1-10]AXP82018.1 photosystem I assembly protein Ycf3 [Mariniflexile sp. TRM1-10]PLB19122.1 MAG: TPR domain protein [Flavobacteriaceae bacterium FS1-H7996/R]